MKIITRDNIIGSDKEVHAKNGNWTSRRFLLKDDDMGFSMHETIIYAGTETHIHYKNHLEAVYCVGGKGEIEEVKSGKVHKLKDGTLYALDEHDEHYLRAYSDMTMICVFNPPLVGNEVHDENGIYPLLDSVVNQ